MGMKLKFYQEWRRISLNNVLLVLSRVPYSFAESNSPPIGLLYVSSCLKRAGLNVFVLNLILDEGDVEELVRKEMEKHDIKFVATGDLVANYREVKEVIDAAKKANPDCVTIIGGGLVTHSPEEAMTIIETADYGVIGEGEVTDAELIHGIINKRDISEIDGVIYRDAQGFCITNPRKEVEDIDTIPWPDYDSFRYFEMVKKGVNEDEIYAPLTTSRSCPFRCTFCSKSGGSKYRQRSLIEVFKEMDYLIETHNVKGFTFNDELFANDAKRVNEFCDLVKERNVFWKVWIRISKHLSLDLLKKMKAAGCITVSYGLESASNEVLKSMNKLITTDEMLRVLKLTKEAQITTDGLFIFGDSAETKETVSTTVNWVYDHLEYLESVNFAAIRLYPGSIIYDRSVADGKIPNTVDFIKNDCPLTNISKMTDDEYEIMLAETLPAASVRIKQKLFSKTKKNLNMKIYHVNDKKYQLEFQCEICKTDNRHELDPLFLFKRPVNCCHCNETYADFSLLYFETYETQITEFLARDDVAIWGLGKFFPTLYTSNDYLQKHETILIDSNPAIQKRGYRDKKVYPPSIINEKEIKIIISCMDNLANTKVSHIIKKDFPQVERFMLLSEIGLSF